MISPFIVSLTTALLQSAVVVGDVRDSVTQAPIVGVIVIDIATRRQTVTDARGQFAIAITPPARLRFERLGYAAKDYAPAVEERLAVTLAPSPRALEAVAVTAFRGGSSPDAAPISQRTISREEIERRSFGQDVPLLLQSAPSVMAHSETGSYWGYSYIRLRGIDQSRINLTIDGIPLNDPEDQVLYFADFPDLANSLESVQIQRGVGTSSAGTASFAGSINFETTALGTHRRGAEVQLAAGSFDTRRVSAEYHSGLLPHGLAVYARLSSLQTNGYRHHSGVLGRSAFVSAGYFGARDVIKVMATAGLLRDTLAYLAVPVSDLAHDRRINPLLPTELDRFGEQLASVAYTRLLGASASLATTLYRISASGNYDVAFAPDLYNYHLDFAWYGLTSAWSWQREGLRASAGVNANRYARDHYAFLRPDLASPLYFNTGKKRDVSGFAKLTYDVGRVSLFGDLQLRRAEFRYVPDVAAGIGGREIAWSFVNPKLGLSYQASPTLQLYGSYGRSSREPARNDMFAGFDNLEASNVAFVGDLERVRPETVHDLEAGFTVRRSASRLQANLFSMEFRNEIAPIGALSDQGLPLRKNVRASHRRGVEVDFAYDVMRALTLSANATLMEARIAEYTDDGSGSTFRDVPPLLSPKLLMTQRLDLRASSSLSLGVEARHTGRAQLDNTGNASLTLPAATVIDASVTWRFFGERQSLELRGNNLASSNRFGSGYGVGGVPHYFVLPPRNFFASLKFGF